MWYSVDAADTDLAVFAAHVDAGLRAWEGVHLPDLPDNASSPGSPREVGARFADALDDAGGRPLLVFDDVHLMEGSRSLDALSEFVERGYKTGARFVFCGRSMPVTLHRIAANGELDTIAAGDLAFDDAEVRAFLSKTVSGPESGELDALAARAEGWPAGLAMIARSGVARRRIVADGAPSGGDNSKKYLFDYLAREVLDGLSDGDRRFLLETSILDRLETRACDSIAGPNGSHAVLESLVDRGMFISRTPPDAYATHTLFKEFLRQELARACPDETIATLHRKAAAYFASCGDPVPAIDHLIRAGSLDEAAMHLERVAFSLLRAGMIGATSRLMDGIGQGRIEAQPALLAVRGRLERERGDWDIALLTLERSVAAARDAHEYDVLAEAVRFIAPILGSRNDLERLEAMLREALSLGAHLPQSSVTSLRMTLAAVHLEADRPDEALAAYREITPSLVAMGDLAGQGLVLHNVAVAHLRRGELYAGLSTYERALKFKEDAGQLASVLHTLGDIIYVKSVIGDVDEATRLTEQMLAKAKDLGMMATVARAHEQQGLLALMRGDVDSAAAAYHAAQSACDPSDVRVLPDIEHGLAQCALQRGNLKDAEFLVARAAAAYRSAGRHQQLAPLLLTQARCAEARGDRAGAARWALEAISAGSRGSDALLECVTGLDAADILVDCAAKGGGAQAAAWESAASSAAARGIALIHERDYRFVLRTKASLFDRLRPSLRRWGVGQVLFPDAASGDTVSSMRVEMLGTLRVWVNGRALPADAWKRRRAPELFAYLVSNRGKPVPRARIVDLYWPESDADSAHDSLRVTITAIRKAVGDVIKYEANSYRFTPPPDASVDADEFDERVGAAREADARGDVAGARTAYGAAVDLYRGEFLEDFADGGGLGRERARLRADCLEALKWLAAERGAAKDHGGQRVVLERLLEVSPFDLDSVRMRLDALVLENRASDAARDYAAWRSRYRQTVGADAPAIWDAPATPSADKAVVSAAAVRGL
jgi:ATP/maltotriose-dependent transcriptional regulator MalT/DNA-binding SARP family transcriptional activator